MRRRGWRVAARRRCRAPGAPLMSALVAADSAVHASNLYNPAGLAPATAGDFTDPLAVYHNFSSTSGDLDNPVTFAVGQTTTVFVLDTWRRRSRQAVTCGPRSSWSTRQPRTRRLVRSPMQRRRTALPLASISRHPAPSRSSATKSWCSLRRRFNLARATWPTPSRRSTKSGRKSAALRRSRTPGPTRGPQSAPP